MLLCGTHAGRKQTFLSAVRTARIFKFSGPADNGPEAGALSVAGADQEGGVDGAYTARTDLGPL